MLQFSFRYLKASVWKAVQAGIIQFRFETPVYPIEIPVKSGTNGFPYVWPKNEIKKVANLHDPRKPQQTVTRYFLQPSFWNIVHNRDRSNTMSGANGGWGNESVLKVYEKPGRKGEGFKIHEIAYAWRYSTFLWKDYIY